jgi:hypothetical protein
MLDQFKKIAELKKLQDSFKKEKEIIEKEGILVEMNGNFEVENIKSRIKRRKTAGNFEAMPERS